MNFNGLIYRTPRKGFCWLFVCTFKYDNYLAFHLFCCEVVVYFAEGAAGGFGVEFADFAADADLAFLTHHLDKLFQ